MGIEDLKIMLEEHGAIEVKPLDLKIPNTVYQVDHPNIWTWDPLMEIVKNSGCKIGCSGSEMYFKELVKEAKSLPEIDYFKLIGIHDTESIFGPSRDKNTTLDVMEKDSKFYFRQLPYGHNIPQTDRLLGIKSIEDGKAIILASPSYTPSSPLNLYTIIKEPAPFYIAKSPLVSKV